MWWCMNIKSWNKYMYVEHFHSNKGKHHLCPKQSFWWWHKASNKQVSDFIVFDLLWHAERTSKPGFTNYQPRGLKEFVEKESVTRRAFSKFQTGFSHPVDPENRFLLGQKFWLMTIYINRALVHHLRWATAFITYIRRFWNFRRLSFINIYRLSIVCLLCIRGLSADLVGV